MIIRFFAAAVLATTACFVEAQRPIPSQPNIVFILADDLGYSDVGFMGQTKIRTPRLDALAKRSLVFDHMYAGGPVCGPSRACLFTGMSQDIGFIKGNPGTKPERENFRQQDLLFSEILQQAGYSNAYFGKWGLSGGVALVLTGKPAETLLEGVARWD